MFVSRRYKHVISLGYFCGSALELQRYGLRDGSYPLDWFISPIESTLTMVESGFHGFLKLDCLSRDHEHPFIVRDTKYGFAEFHSFDPALSIAEQYEGIRNKYERRIRRFRRAVTQRTLFVRYIADFEEFSYLDGKMPAVLALLRQTHPQNDLLLVGNDDLPATCGGMRVYTVAADNGDIVAREFVRKSPQLRHRLLALNYPFGLRLRNLFRYRWLTRHRRRQIRGDRLRRFLRLRTRLRNLRGFIRRRS